MRLAQLLEGLLKLVRQPTLLVLEAMDLPAHSLDLLDVTLLRLRHRCRHLPGHGRLRRLALDVRRLLRDRTLLCRVGSHLLYRRLMLSARLDKLRRLLLHERLLIRHLRLELQHSPLMLRALSLHHRRRLAEILWQWPERVRLALRVLEGRPDGLAKLCGQIEDLPLLLLDLTHQLGTVALRLRQRVLRLTGHPARLRDLRLVRLLES